MNVDLFPNSPMWLTTYKADDLDGYAKRAQLMIFEPIDCGHGVRLAFFIEVKYFHDLAGSSVEYSKDRMSRFN